MNKSVIKNFAVSARVKLIEAIVQKAYELGITRKEIKEPEVYQDGFRINGKFFKKYQMKQRNKLLQRIKDQGFDQVIEEVAYTWFNRLIAIRFMEVNEYLPTGVRVLSSLDKEKIEPDAVTEVLTISEDLDLDLEVVYRLQDENNSEELFKYILVKQCNKLGEIMPVMFEQIEDYTELLLPDYLLSEGSVVRDLVSMIDEEDWKEQVEIIGWLYQYYISEKKDQVFADLKKNKKITKENIPAATQLFTPKWIVKYMVENSLGRLWLESHPNEDLQKEWKYYLEEAEQEPQVQEQLEKLKNKQLSPEDIKVLDPCMGSGHILVYAFDVLYKIYKSAGYPERGIPQMILEKNLYGLDIDDRAAQLAYFALMMKARSYNRRIFRKKIELNVCAIQESNNINSEIADYFSGKSLDFKEVSSFVNLFKDAKNYGSILKLNKFNLSSFEERIDQLRKNEEADLFSLELLDKVLKIFPSLIKQSEILSNSYDVVITNPPYMSFKGINNKLALYLRKHYDISKMDLFSVFIERCLELTSMNKFTAMITQHSWMYLMSFEGIRNCILDHKTIYSLLHLGTRSFEDISGEVVQSTSFNIRHIYIPKYRAYYHRLVNFKSSVSKRNAFLTRESDVYLFTQEDFSYIPRRPLAYWMSRKMMDTFQKPKLGDIAFSEGQLLTGNNEKYLRFLWEVENNKISIHKKWVLHAKGGENRKWYGNIEYVVDWSEEAREHYQKDKIARIPPENIWFRNGIVWSGTSSVGNFGVRILENNCNFNKAAPTIFMKDIHEDKLYFIIGLLNSNFTLSILNSMNPTMYTAVNDVLNIPYKIEQFEIVTMLVKGCIRISKEDWDSFETSWNFKSHPFLLNKNNFQTISQTFNTWVTLTNNQFYKLKENEEHLNQIFVEIYGLEDELTSEIDDKDVTVRKGDKERDVKSFISYTVGCMLGRYSLDQEGLVYAGGEFDESKYVTFKADADNIIPITEDEYFEDDIVTRFIDFVRITFGQDTLEENLDFIADALTRKANETSRQRIRRYFVKEFYKDHVHTYQKRPIYWLFDSGKNDGFKALIYMHRYDAGTVARIRTDYLHTLQRKYEAEISRLDLVMEADVSAQEKTRAKKQKEKIQKQLLECQQYDQVIAHVANQKIKIDLDDGVKVNYAKFQSIEVPQGEGKKPLNADLLAKI